MTIDQPRRRHNDAKRVKSFLLFLNFLQVEHDLFFYIYIISTFRVYILKA